MRCATLRRMPVPFFRPDLGDAEIDEVVATHTPLAEMNPEKVREGHFGYGYMWWGICRGEDDCDFAAEGNLGQMIYVSPRSNLIIVKNSAGYGDLGWHQWDDLLSRVAASFAEE